jgi:hypothetical protein
MHSRGASCRRLCLLRCGVEVGLLLLKELAEVCRELISLPDFILACTLSWSGYT